MLSSRFGNFVVTGELGSGGMGVVYRAHDTKLDREVAIKMIRDGAESDSDLQVRFQREAKVLAALNHPHIAQIYGLEEVDTTKFLVMELVEGETLAARLKRTALDTREALEYARQIAEGLECAHEHGIIHRDLKPANVKVTPDGSVKVLDFGLAKPVRPLPQATSPEGMTATVTVAVTEPQTIVGTAPYMSPEQVRCEELDSRTDIWSFGCLLYELLTRHQLIDGKTTTEIIASVLKSEPDMKRLPPDVPDNIHCLLRRCLQKDRRCRLRHIGDARLELEEALGLRESTRPVAKPAKDAARWKIATAAAAILAVGSLAWAGWRLIQSPAPDEPVTRFAMNLPAGQRIVASFNPSVAISPNGRTLFYIVPTADKPGFVPFLRPLDRFESATPATITGGVPMFSPDSASMSFVNQSSTQLLRASLNGGAPQLLANLEGLISQGEWAQDGFIYWTPAVRSGICRTPADGGETRAVTELDLTKGEQTHRHARLLPGGKTVMMTLTTTATESFDDAAVVAQSLETKRRKTLIQGGFCARYVPSGHLVYARAGNLYAVPFDPNGLNVKGSPIVVQEGVLMSTNTGAAYYSISQNGTLVFVPGTAEGGKRQVVWVDRSGKETPLPLPERAYLYPRLSPDGKRLAIEIEGPAHDFHVYEFDRGVLTRMTLDGMSHAPVWSPDGKRIAFRSWREGGMTLWAMPADRSAPEERLLGGKNMPMQSAVSWSSDGNYISYVDRGSDSMDLFMLPMKGEHQPVPFVQSKFTEGSPKFSPDGKWVSYCSNESGRAEVYVQPFPGPGPKIQISSEGGTDPVWRRTPGELFYRNGDAMMVVDVKAGPAFRAGRPRELWRGHYSHGMSSSCGPPGVTSFNYEVTPDGQRFLMIKDAYQDLAATRIHVIMGWTRELARLKF